MLQVTTTVTEYWLALVTAVAGGTGRGCKCCVEKIHDAHDKLREDNIIKQEIEVLKSGRKGSWNWPSAIKAWSQLDDPRIVVHGDSVHVSVAMNDELVKKLRARVQVIMNDDAGTKADFVLSVAKSTSRYALAMEKMAASGAADLTRLLDVEDETIFSDGQLRNSADGQFTGLPRDPLLQKATELPTLLAQAKVAQAQLLYLVQVAWALQCSILDSGTKTEESAQRKGLSRYNSQWERIRDYARIGLVFENVESMLRAIQIIKSSGLARSLENRFRVPTSMGWRDITILVEVPVGLSTHIGEIQLMNRFYAEARKDCHAEYKKVRIHEGSEDLTDVSCKIGHSKRPRRMRAKGGA